MYFIPKQVQFHLYILHGWLKTCLKARKVGNHHFWRICLNLMVKTLPSKSTEHKNILDEVLNLINVSTTHLDANWPSLHNKQVYVLPVGFIQHTCSSKVSWLMESNTTFSSISRLFEEDLSSKPYSTSAVSKSLWKICVKWDAPNFLGGSLWNQLNITYSICWVQFYIFDHITKNCQRHNSFPIIYHCKFPQSQSIFYFFGRSTDNSDIYVHVLILLKLINCYSKTAVAFLFVLLELKSFLFHSGFLGQFEFRWLVCFYKTAYNTTLIFLLEFIYSVPLLGKKQTSRTHSS